MASPVIGDSVWGVSDCFSFLAPEGTERPTWLKECPTERAALRQVVKRYGGLAEAFEAEGLKAGIVRVDDDPKPGDRVLGVDKRYGIVCAVVQPNYTHVVRTHTGTTIAQWRKIIAVGRVKEK